jgi:hypothetical protein
MTTLRVLALLTVTQITAGQKFLDGFLGCAWDRSSRDLHKWFSGSYTINTCRKKAAKSRLKYFGLQVGHQCFGGNSFGKYGFSGADSYCFGGTKSNERSQEIMHQHGSNWQNAIYTTSEQWYTLSRDKSMRRKGTFIGCYWDNSARQYKTTFKNQKGQSVNNAKVNSVEECGTLAVKNKMPYFAMQMGTECRMSKKMFPHQQSYAQTYGNSACSKRKPKKSSKKYGNFGGSNWINAIYYSKPSLYYPAAYWEAINGDDTIRLAWAHAYCLNVQGGKYKKGAKIIAYHCANNRGYVSGNMKFEFTKGKIRCKESPTWCITLPKPKHQILLVIDKCASKDAIQDVQLFDDMTIRFTKHMKLGFNVNGGIGGRDSVNNRNIMSYDVTAANNEAFVMRSSTPPTPKPTPAPTPVPPTSGLKKAKGWDIVKGYQKGKGCTIDISTGVPCAVSPNFPKKYPAEQSCLVKMKKTQAVKTEKFVTEKYFDVVSIGSIKMHGLARKKRTIVLPKKVDSIKWTADFYLAGKGWKLCKTKKPSLKLPGAGKKKKLNRRKKPLRKR